MRNNYIVKIILGLSVSTFGLTACNSQADHNSHAPTHQEQIPDSSVTSLTAAVNTRIISEVPAIKADSGTRVHTTEVDGVVTYDTRNQTNIASRVGGRVERLLIKYNFQPVKKGQLIMEVYSPDLAAAQRELLYVARSNGEMLGAAKQRLILLGMAPAQVAAVIKTGNILYRVPVYSPADGYILERSAATTQAPAAMPSSATASADGMGGMVSGASAAATPTPTAPSSTPVLLREGQYVNAGQSLFTIYQAKTLIAEFAFPAQTAAVISKGQKILFFPTADETAMESGSIGLIEPVFKNGVNFSIARVYLPTDHLQVGQLLTANIPVVYTRGWWLPKKAVLQMGNKSVVFRKDKTAYVPVEVETGAHLKDVVQVLSNIGSWEVASNAYYLVDSESFIKTTN
ncbi:efflux RND transporter periplasmic adaptor subunit [Chitinophaga sp. Hz27]|uniref:efflux RND transporter periplasmic adaptor subunit n=1 Tax=Chitinophaga sp. Hz27 TaxID=3347169 RepID=UPI0035DE4BFA